MGVFWVVLGAIAISVPALAGAFVQPDYGTLSAAQSGVYMNIAETRNLKGAESFITSLSTEGIAFLKDENLGTEQRKAAFKKLLETRFDVEKIGQFSMGRYWRSATPEQQKQYQTLFKDMLVNVYTKRFEDYQGQALEVGTAREEGSKDIVVSSKLVSTNGEPDVLVDWRVRPHGNTYKVIDVIVEGVSMAVTQRSDFASVIQRGGGDVAVLLAHLEK